VSGEPQNKRLTTGHWSEADKPPNQINTNAHDYITISPTYITFISSKTFVKQLQESNLFYIFFTIGD